ncbi:hypothetical protein HKX48_000592 [Thoreauomyces humboldtii]|nr:hypothetical protein HKX48_000592 [Thoreauomyces humboldtii]
MLYLLGVNLPDSKTVPIALTHIYGIGHHTANQVCHKLAIHPRCRLVDLPEAKTTQLSALLNTMTLDAELIRETRNRVDVMVATGRYRGARHKAGLPVNGQRTHTNRQIAKKRNGNWLRRRDFSTTTVAATRVAAASSVRPSPPLPISPSPSLVPSASMFRSALRLLSRRC